MLKAQNLCQSSSRILSFMSESTKYLKNVKIFLFMEVYVDIKNLKIANLCQKSMQNEEETRARIVI